MAVEILRQVHGRLLGLDKNDNLVLGGTKIVIGHSAKTDTVIDLAALAIGPSTPQTAVEITAGVTPSNTEYTEGDIRRYGAIPDGLTDNTTAINSWILVAQTLGYGLVPAGVGAYLTSGNHAITKSFNMIGQGGGAYSNSVPQFLLSANATNLFNWNGLANGGPTIAGIIISGIVFHGNGKVCSDALVALQGITRATILACGFQTVTGIGVRMRQFWDSVMRDCMWRSITASGTTGVLVADSRYNADANQNVNTLVIDRAHFEGNKGSWIVSATDSNFDLFKLLNSKLEASSVNTSSVPLINLNQASNVFVTGNNFDSITAENNYASVFKLGDTTAGSSCTPYNIHGNDFVTTSANSVLVDAQGSTKGDFHDNQQSNVNVTPKFSCVATGANRLEFPRNFAVQADINQTIFRAGMAQHGFTSATCLGSSAAYSQDTASLSPSQGVVALTAPGSIFCSFSIPTWSGLPGSLRVGIRCKSATGAGSIVLTVNTTDLAAQTVPTTTFSTIWFDIPNTFLSIMGQSGSDRFRIKAGGSNAEVVTVDGIYFMQVPWHYTASFTYDPPSLGAGVGATTTVAVSGAALGDSVEVYPPYDLQGVLESACVSSTGNVRLSLFNPTGTVDLASGTWTVRVTKK